VDLFSRRESPVVGKLSVVAPFAEAGPVSFSLDRREEGPMFWVASFGQLLSDEVLSVKDPSEDYLIRLIAESGLVIAENAIPSLVVSDEISVDIAHQHGDIEIRVSAVVSFLASQWDAKKVIAG